MRKDYAVEADSLKPYIVPWIAAAVAAGGAASGSAGAGGALTAHELNGPYHLGTLNRSQAPWVATDIASAIASHAALPDVHHARQHSITSSADHSITGAALSLVGATALDTLGLVTPSNNPGGTEAVLKSTGGLLTLPNIVLTTKVTTPHAGSPSTFNTGFTGSGYRLDDGLATAGKTTLEIDEMIVRGRMRVYELLIHQIRATNGSVFVTGVGKAKTVAGTGPYTIGTETDHGFAPNDLIRAQRFTGSGVYQCNMLVTSVATTLQFTATLSSGDPPAPGMEFVRLGNTTDATRQGSIYLTADDTFAPAIDILDGVTSFAEWGAASKIKVRLGRLTSTLDANLLPSGYGLYAPNAYLSGDLLTGAGAIRIYNASGINIAQDVWGSWDNKRAVQWWPDVASMSGSPSLSIYTGKAVGGFTDQQNFSYIDANPTGGRLAGLSLTAFGQGTGGLATIYLEGGSQALATIPSITLFGATINLQDNVYASGNVGIGVAAGYKLDVGDRMRVRTGAAGSGGIWYADSAANNRSFAGLYTDGASPIWGVWNNGDWRFFIDSAGNTGIGVAPQRTLHVHSGTEAVLLLTNTASGAGFNDGLYVGIQNSGAYVWLYEALPLIFGTSGTERFRVTSGGDVGIGVTPSYKLDVNGAAHASSFPTSSDARLKTGLAPIQGALGRLSRITPYNFYWRQGYNGYDQFLDEDGQPRLQIGFVAQEVEAEFPEVISTWRHGGNIPLDDARAVDYARLVPVLWSAVQELHAEVLELRSQLN